MVPGTKTCRKIVNTTLAAQLLVFTWLYPQLPVGQGSASLEAKNSTHRFGLVFMAAN